MKGSQEHSGIFYFSVAFIISTLIQASLIICMVFLLFNNNVSSTDVTSDQKVSDAQNKVPISESATVLFGTSVQGDSPDLFALMKLDNSDRIINITILPKDLYLTINELGNTLSVWQQKNGIVSAKEAVASSLGIKVDKVVYMNKDKFTNMLAFLNPPQISLSNPLSITDSGSGLRFELEAGNHDLNAVTFVNMLASLLADNKTDMLSNAFSAIVAQRGAQIFNADGTSFYDNYISTSLTDIGVEDYKSAVTPLKIIFSSSGSTVRTFKFSYVETSAGSALSTVSKQDVKKYF